MKTLKSLRTIAAASLLCMMLILGVGCNAQQTATSQTSASAQTAPSSSASAQTASSGAASAESASSGETPAQGPAGAPTAEQYETVLLPTNIVSTFVGEKFYDQKVTDERSALDAVKSVYDRIGADETTDLEVTAIRPTETGTTYYVFNQKAGDVFVYGASAKLVVDKNGEVTGLASAVLPQVELAPAEIWEVSAAEAEQAVVRECGKDGHADVKTIDGATEKALIPVPGLTERRQYAWVVYTPNYDHDSEVAYLAHYVDANGTYLYALPIAEPHNANAVTGDATYFDFDKYEQSTWSGTVTLHDGTTKNIEVPVLVDKNDNTTILADGKRKILCADYAEMAYRETLLPRTSADATFANDELLLYDTFVKVWNFYDSVGWTGADGEGTPTLLLMDYVDSNGQPADDAMYMGRQIGFQVFTFNRLNPDGENMDVVAHEFTHCITSTVMAASIYLNETGAINEGMSDVLGNLVEMLAANKPEIAWLMGDGSGGDRTLRSMKDPHAYRQPEFRWDAYYTPNVETGTVTNDYGGVHVNSSLLSIVSYKLDQAGMPSEDQFYFWMNAELAMTPHADFGQLAQLLPWCMEQSGYPQYADALKAAIDAAGYTTLEEPQTTAPGNGKVAIQYGAEGIAERGFARFTLIPANTSDNIITWPAAGSHKAACTVPAGDYACFALVGDANPNQCTTYAYTGESWKALTEAEGESAESTIHVKEGETLELSAQGLPEKLDDGARQ